MKSQHLRSARSVVLGTTLVMGAVSATATAASGSTAQASLPKAVPAATTPNVDNGRVEAIAQVGGLIVLGGSFTSASEPGNKGTDPISTPYVLAFSAASGQIETTAAPVLNGEVYAVAPGPTAGTAYLGGAFTTVNGVVSRSLTLVDLTTGKVVAGFAPPTLNGPVWTIRTTSSELFVGGSFTVANGLQRGGLASLNPTTGAVDGYLRVQLAGHHNYTGQHGQAQSPVGAHRMDVDGSGTHLVVEGNFKTANGLSRDQLVLVDLSATATAVDPGWETQTFTATCASNAFDTYTRDVAFAPDGTYFTVATTGGGSSLNTDGTRSLCDSVSRFETAAGGNDIQPTWVDYSGKDSFESIADTGTAVYAGGHERWVNNPTGQDNAGEGAVPRPGIAALDPSTGLPFAWNPGRNPRGAGAYSLLATPTDLYVGSDTDFIGNYQYYRGEIAEFHLSGGEVPPTATAAALPATVYLAGPAAASSGTPDSMDERSFTGTAAGATAAVPGASGVSWSQTHGAFVANGSLYYGDSTGALQKASFDGSTLGTPTEVAPWADPYWANVQTGSHNTYLGVAPNLYGSELQSVTGMTYSNGRLYYTLAGKPGLYFRSFELDDGVIGGLEYQVTTTSVDFSAVSGMFLAGSDLYYADGSTGALHSLAWDGGAPDASTNTIVSGPALDGNDWRAHSLFALTQR